MKITILGLSLSSSWGNGHATTFRGLVKALSSLGHEVVFLEREVPWYRENRDLPNPDYCRLLYYNSMDELRATYHSNISGADMVIIGSYVPDGVEVAEWVFSTAQGITAFYDIDTPVTLYKLDHGDYEYLTPALVPKFDMYLSFSGGSVLELLEKKYKAKKARALYCSFDQHEYFPEKTEEEWLMGYLGTYSIDRQSPLEELLVSPARKLETEKFVIAGPGYPQDIEWPTNVNRIEHLPPSGHRNFYCSQRVTLNVTRSAMRALGYSPSVRLFEAAACGTAILSDWWEGLDEFFVPGKEILIAHGTLDAISILKELNKEKAFEIGQRAQQKVMKSHTAKHRAEALVSYVREITRELV